MSRKRRSLLGVILCLALLLAIRESGLTAGLFDAVPHGQPKILAPIDSSRFPLPDKTQFALIGSTPVTFAWTSLAGAAQYFFEFTGADLQFANPEGKEPDGVNGFGGAGGGFPVAGTEFTTTIEQTFPPGVYQVRVIGVSRTGMPKGVFSDAVTLIVGAPPLPPGTDRTTVTAPPADSTLMRGTPVTFAWSALAGVTQYGFEFTGANRQFANPNGAGPDPVNGFGGAGGGSKVLAPGLSTVLGPSLLPGTYQVRVIGLSPSGLPMGTFSDAVTVIVQ